MKVALVGPYYPDTGGVQIYVTYLARELMAMGHEITVISYAGASSQLGEKVKKAPKIGVPGIRGLTFISYSAYSLLKDQFDVISAHYALTSGLSGFIASLAGRKYVVTFHGSDLRMRTISKLAASRASAVVSVSSWIKEELSNLGIRVNRIIPGGIDPDLFTGLPSREEAKGMLGLSGYIVLSIGAFTYAKGFDLIPLISSLVLREVDAKFVLIGNGPLLKDLKAQVSSLGLEDRVYFVGRKNPREVPLYYRAADVLLHPARYEGYGLVALESLAAGTPVVATDVGGLRDAVRDGIDGFLVKQEPRAIASKVIALLKSEDLRRKMGENGRRRALKRTWRIVAKEYVEVFNEVIG